MSATRLLILGAIIERGRAHGYQVRSDLKSWQVDLWGNIRQGSIYHGLRQLTTEGFLEEAATTSGGGPARVEYTVTGTGRQAFLDLLEEALASDGRDIAETMAGIGFMNRLPRARVIELLQRRIEAFRTRRARVTDVHEREADQDWGHHLEAVRFWAHSADSAISWTEGLIARLAAGEYEMADQD